MTDQDHVTAREASGPPPEAPTTTSAKVRWGSTIIVVVMAVALSVGTFALMQLDSWGEHGDTVPQRFELDLREQVHVPSELIGFVERSKFDTSLQTPRRLAVSGDGTILVAGDRAIVRLTAAGQVLNTIPLEQSPVCLAAVAPAAGDPGRIYVGCGRQVVVLTAKGELLARWPELGQRAVLTSIAVGPQRVFVADAGQRLVHVLDLEGRAVAQIGAADPARHTSDFVIPSPYFDVVAGPDESVWVVNPGKRRIESYSAAGELQTMWGRGGAALADFFGCCNPAHLAVMPDGRFVTSEKGIPRIKTYTAAGEFACVVAGPSELGVSESALGDARGDQVERIFDVAVAPDGAVFVLDALERCVRVFYPRDAEPKSS